MYGLELIQGAGIKCMAGIKSRGWKIINGMELNQQAGIKSMG
jgi:hypothetical protein